MTSNIPKILTFNDIEYVLCDTIKNESPIWWGKVRNTREFVESKKIDNKNYIFARKITKITKITKNQKNDENKIIDDTNEWITSDGKLRGSDKVYIKKDYLMSCENYLNEINGKKVVNDDGIEKAPNIIELLDDEKFHDDDGNVLEIETRGERKWDKILFKVKDVADIFDIPNLYSTLLHKDSSYVIGKHYQYFSICKIMDNIHKKANGKTVAKKELFLTYCGMLRLMFVSENGKTDKFIQWATETLFTLQMGTDGQKQKLAKEIMGVNLDVMREVIKTYISNCPEYIYLHWEMQKISKRQLNLIKNTQMT